MEAPAVAPAVAPVAEAKGFGSLIFKSVKEMAENYSENVKAKAKNTVGEHKAQLFGEATNMGASIERIGSENFEKLKGVFSRAPAAAAGGRRTRRRKSSRKSKGKSRKSKKSTKSKKSKTNSKKSKRKSKRVRFSLRRR